MMGGSRACTDPLPEPTGPGYWIRNDAGWWGPYDLAELADTCDPQPDERLYGVAAGTRIDLGPLVSRYGVGRWITEKQR